MQHIVTNEMKTVLTEALSIGTNVEREKTRHRRAGERLMVSAAENVYAAHLAEAIGADGFATTRRGSEARDEARQAAKTGLRLTASAYALVLGFSEAYVSRLYRLGAALAVGIVEPGDERWAALSRGLADTPEVGAVLGKEADTLPTVEALDTAMEAARKRKQDERDEASAMEAMDEILDWVPSSQGERLERLETLVAHIEHGRHLTHNQIERLQKVMDEIRGYIEQWIGTEQKQAA